MIENNLFFDKCVCCLVFTYDSRFYGMDNSYGCQRMERNIYKR